MSIPKVAWSVCILAALSLGGCVVDATETEGDVEENLVGQGAWDLAYEEDEAPGGNDDGEDGDVGDDVDDGDDYLAGGALRDRIDEVVEPHPDPWFRYDGVHSEGPGSEE